MHGQDTFTKPVPHINAAHRELLQSYGAVIFSHATDIAEQRFTMEKAAFGHASLLQQSFCADWASSASLLPFLSKVDAPELEEVDDAAGLWGHFEDENKPAVKAQLELIAAFQRDSERANAFIRMLKLRNDSLHVECTIVVCFEKLRVSAARALLARCARKRGETPYNFLEWSKHKDTDLPVFVKKDSVKDALAEFAQAIHAAKGLVQSKGHTVGNVAFMLQSAGRYRALVEDAELLWSEKMRPVIDAIVGGVGLLKTTLDGALVDYEPYTIQNEDVERIKKELIAAPMHHMLCPLVQGLSDAGAWAKDALTSCHVDGVEQIVKAWDDVVFKGKSQIAASAICVGIYITSTSKAKASTKIQSLKQVKALMNELGIAPHLTLQARMAAKVEELKAQTAKDGKPEAAS